MKGKFNKQKEIILEQSVSLENMRTELKHKSLILLEVHIDQLQTTISEKDTTVGILELRGTHKHRKSLGLLQREKLKLTKELKSKVI